MAEIKIELVFAVPPLAALIFLYVEFINALIRLNGILINSNNALLNWTQAVGLGCLRTLLCNASHICLVTVCWQAEWVLLWFARKLIQTLATWSRALSLVKNQLSLLHKRDCNGVEDLTAVQLQNRPKIYPSEQSKRRRRVPHDVVNATSTI